MNAKDRAARTREIEALLRKLQDKGWRWDACNVEFCDENGAFAVHLRLSYEVDGALRGIC